MSERNLEQPDPDVLRQVDNLPTTFLECRTLGHAWRIRWWGNIREIPEDMVPQIVRDFRWSLIRVAVCLRCRTIRDEFFPKTESSSFERFQAQYRRYRYPGTYQVKGHGSPRRAVFSKSAFERWKVGDPEFHVDTPESSEEWEYQPGG